MKNTPLAASCAVITESAAWYPTLLVSRSAGLLIVNAGPLPPWQFEHKVVVTAVMTPLDADEIGENTCFLGADM